MFPSLPSVSLFPLDFGVRWRTDFPPTMSRLWSPFCPQILRGPRRGRGSWETGSLIDPPLTLLPELIYECFSHSIPNSCPSRTRPILCLGYGAGISSGTLGIATHTDTLRGSATHSVPLRYLCHGIKLHTLSLRHNHIPVTYTGSSIHTFCPFLHT